MKKLLSIVLFTLTVAVGTSMAQTVPPPTPVSSTTTVVSIPASDFAAAAVQNGLPIRNLAVLKAYAEDNVKQGLLYISHPGILPDRYVQVRVPADTSLNASKVLEILRSKRFAFDLADITGQVWLYVSLTDLYGHPKFEDNTSSSFEIQKGGNVWLADSRRSLRPKMVKVQAIEMQGLESARAVLYDNTGTNLVFQGSLRVDGWYLQYPTNLVGRTGEYILNFKGGDGSLATVVFDASGAVKVPQPASGSVSIDIDGDYSFGTNPGSVQLFGVDIRPAIVWFALMALPDGTVPPVALGGQSSTGESPIGVLFRDVTGSEGQFVYRDITPGTDPSNTMYLGLPEGRYQLIYIMEPADLDNIPILPPGYYGDYPTAEKGSLKKQ